MLNISPSQLLVPGTESPDLLTITVKAGGSQLPDTARVQTVRVSRAANRVPFAVLTFLDGEVSTQKFKISDTDLLSPGRELEILAGYHGKEKTIFKGMIVRHTVRSPQSGQSNIEIECKDMAVKLTAGRRNRYFYDQSDSDIIEEILRGRGFSQHEVDSTTGKHREMVQYNATDWDFLNTRAEANGLLVLVRDGKVLVKKPDFDQAVKFPLAFGTSFWEFEAEMDARDQYPTVKAQTWNPDNQEIEESEPEGGGGFGGGFSIPTPPPAVAALAQQAGGALGINLPGTPPNTDYSKVMGLENWPLQHPGALKSEEAQAWAKAQKTKGKLAKSRGRVKFQGTADVQPGDMLKLEGVGLRHSGKVFVTAVTHEIGGGLWHTHAQFGLSQKWFSEEFTDVAALPAGGLLPPMHGLQIGIVTALENDPEHADRIQVRLPLIDNRGEGIWMRIASQDAGNNRGAFWRPEIQDEVVVGFFHDDPREAVVLGMLNSSAKPAPLRAKDENHQKGWVTRSGLKWIFDDEKKSVLLETPGGKKLTLDDDAKKIHIEDENGNKITFDSDGITIESFKNLTFKAAKDVKIDGVNITQKASAAFKAEGQSQAQLTASGDVTVKGAFVKIN